MTSGKPWFYKIDYLGLLRISLVLIIVFSVGWKVAGSYNAGQEVFAAITKVVPTIVPTPQPSPVPAVVLPVSDGSPIPVVSAKNLFIIDRESHLVLFAKNADDVIYPASTTKMMTAIVVYEHFGLDQPVTVQSAYPEGVNISLQPGEKVTVANLLYGMLVQSANDAAEVLADAYPGGKPAFIEAMNKKAADMHLEHTRFLNPTGLDQEGHYSSASDLARIADYLLDIPYLAKIVATQNAVIASTDSSVYYPLANVNQLLGDVNGVIGVKTGFTDLAGESLVTVIDRDGHCVIISLLGSSDRFTDTKKLIDWVYASYSWPE